MEAVEHVNREALSAGLFWAVILNSIRRTLLSLITLPPSLIIRQVISGALFFVAFLLYPMLLTFVMRGKTPIWRNVTAHATAGSLLALFGILLISGLGQGLWPVAALAALAIVLLMVVILPWARENPHLKEERNRRHGVWKQLAKLSLLQLMFLRIPNLG